MLPIVVALDYGGVLRWTHYLISLAALAATVFALPSLLDADCTGGWRRHRLLIPLMLWAAYAWFQTVPMPQSIVARLSPGSAQAYTEWTAPYLDATLQPVTFPISVAPSDSWHVFGMLLVLIGVAWAAAQAFHSRARIGWLLCLISIGATINVLIGIWRLVVPDSLAWSAIANADGQTFGAFVNRNNAALFLNLGLAASLGLLSWRLTAMTGLEVDDPSFEFNDLLSLINDRESVVGVVGTAICFTGILICGSRGGIVSALVGGLLAFGWVRQRRGFMSLPVVGAVVALAAACLIIPFNLDLKSLQRFELTAEADASTILRDGRMDHWRDGLEAGIAYLPAGSGLSTYAYAHLPFKKTGPHAWYHHADNLWLELMVEQGVVGIILFLLVLVFVVQSLHHLSFSLDPLDQGLRTTGWYALGAILASQAFDFGLIIPANLLVSVILFSAILARDASSRITLEREAKGVVFKSKSVEIFAIAGAAASLAALLVSIPVLRNDAVVESAVRGIQARFDSIKADPMKLQEASQELQRVAGIESPPEVTTLLSDIDYHLARVTEVMEARPKNIEEMGELYAQTGVVPRRLRWRQNPSEDGVRLASNSASDKESTRLYRESLNQARQTLLSLPLDSVSRTKYVYLDFIHRDSELTSLALHQLRQIYRNNPAMLMRLGVFAADSGETATAVEMWQSALLQEPAYTWEAIGLTEQRNDIEFTQVVPRQAKNFRAAATYLLAKGIQNDAFLIDALEGLDCDSSSLLAERANCEQLAGDIEFRLGRFDDAFDSYRSAVKRTPADIDLRLKLIHRLRDQGRIQESRALAQEAKQLFPDDGRFQSAIEELALIDLQELESQKN